MANSIIRSASSRPILRISQDKAETATEEREHPAEISAGLIQDRAEPQADRADAEGLGLHGLELPVDARVGAEPPSGSGAFVERLAGAVAVEADRGGAEEDFGE
jgi:hypothetical protein